MRKIIPCVGKCVTKGSQANIISQPIKTYSNVEKTKNFLTKKHLKTVPAIASPQTRPNKVHPKGPLTVINRNGVNVPAIKK